MCEADGRCGIRVESGPTSRSAFYSFLLLYPGRVVLVLGGLQLGSILTAKLETSR